MPTHPHRDRGVSGQPAVVADALTSTGTARVKRGMAEMLEGG